LPRDGRPDIGFAVDNDSPPGDYAQPSNMRTKTLGSRSPKEGLQAPVTPCHAYEQETAVKGADETCETYAKEWKGELVCGLNLWRKRQPIYTEVGGVLAGMPS
jgi:hypothetical protein